MLDRGEAHLGFVCGLPYVWKADSAAPQVELLAAPVMARPRYGNRPIYFSDVVVRADSSLYCFGELRGTRWAYNEPSSHSGYNLVRYKLARLRARDQYFSSVVESGTHQNSLQLVLDGPRTGVRYWPARA